MQEKARLVIVFFGCTASGKSFLAQAWAKGRGCRYYNTDVVRKQLAGLDPTQRCPQPVGEGIYSVELTRRTYATMLQRTKSAFQNQQADCVVLDGSYQDRQQRRRAQEELAGECRLVFVLCRCSAEVTRRRLAEREASPGAVSDGRWEIYLHQKDSFEQPLELAEDQLLVLDTDASLSDLTTRIDRFLAGE